MSSVLSSSVIEQIQKKIEENTEEKNGHLIWINHRKYNSFDFMVEGVRKNAWVWYHIWQNREIFDGLNVYYKSICEVDNCISHYVPVQSGIDCVEMMTYWDQKYYLYMLEKNSKQSGECRIWMGHKNETGYGICNYIGTSLAHIASYMLYNLQPIPEGKIILHSCIKTPACINPNHLTLGTRADNAKDRIRDGTQARGENASLSKLTEEQVKEIIKALNNGESQTELAEKYNVGQTSINNIAVGKTWRHLRTTEELKILDSRKRKRKEEKDAKDAKASKKPFEIAQEIRAAAKEVKKTYTEWGEQFGVNKHFVGKVLRNEAYLPPKSEEEKLKDYFTETRQRILSHVNIVADEKDSTKEHWIWNASHMGPYGQSSFKNKKFHAHIVSYLAFNEIKPEDIDWECIRHECTFKNCVNPNHLTPGSMKQNAEDKIRDGTSRRGEKHPNCNISENLARQIKRSKGEGTQLERAKKFGVTLGIVTAIDKGIAWAWLKC